jgi:hypothetical protein
MFFCKENKNQFDNLQRNSNFAPERIPVDQATPTKKVPGS